MSIPFGHPAQRGDDKAQNLLYGPSFVGDKIIVYASEQPDHAIVAETSGLSQGRGCNESNRRSPGSDRIRRRASPLSAGASSMNVRTTQGFQESAELDGDQEVTLSLVGWGSGEVSTLSPRTDSADDSDGGLRTDRKNLSDPRTPSSSEQM